MEKGNEVDEERTPGRSGFPGGTPRLPRLNSEMPTPAGIKGSVDEPAVEFVTGGFLEDELTRARRTRRPADADDDRTDSATSDPVYASFTDYSPNESLFFHPAGTRCTTEPDSVVDDDIPLTPHAILRVTPDASWQQIKSAHRSLLAELHPDRFVTATQAERDRAAEQLAEVNLAFHTLDKERRAS